MTKETNIPDNREQQRAEKQVRYRTKGVSEDIGTGSIQAVHPFADEDLPFLEERRDAGNRHESEECHGEEVDGESVVLVIR